jgi:hypothetical protein
MGLNVKTEDIIGRSVMENGKDLPLGIKLGEYVNEVDRMDILKFLKNTRSTSLPWGL